MSVNHFDQASRYGAKLNAGAFTTWLLGGLPPGLAFRGWLDTRTIPFPGDPDRICDTVAALFQAGAAPSWWAMPIEFQAQPDGEMFGRELEYLGRLWRELRPPEKSAGRYLVGAVVINLTGRGHTSRDMVMVGTNLRTCLQVIERNLQRESEVFRFDD